MGVGIDYHHAKELRHPHHLARAENLAGSDRKRALQRPPRKHGKQWEGIEEALVVRAEKERALARQILEPFYFDSGKNVPDHFEQTRQDKNKTVSKWPRLCNMEHRWVSGIFAKHVTPSGKLLGWALSRGEAFAHGIDEFTDRINFREPDR